MQTTGTVSIGCGGQWNMPWWVQTLQRMKCFSKNRKQILACDATPLPKTNQDNTRARQSWGILRQYADDTSTYIMCGGTFAPLLEQNTSTWCKKKNKNKNVLTGRQNSVKPIICALLSPSHKSRICYVLGSSSCFKIHCWCKANFSIFKIRPITLVHICPKIVWQTTRNQKQQQKKNGWITRIIIAQGDGMRRFLCL